MTVPDIIDIVVCTFLAIAFYAGFQRGIVKIFSLAAAGLITLLALLWLFPYLHEFMRASSVDGLPPSNDYHILSLVVFITGTVVIYALLRHLWLSKSSSYSAFGQKVLGGIILSGLMMVSLATILIFVRQADIINDRHLNDSRFMPIVDPIEKWGKEGITMLTGRELAKP